MSALPIFSTRLSLFIRFSLIVLALSILTTSCATNRKQTSAISPNAGRAEKAANQKQPAAVSPDANRVAKARNQKQPAAEYPDSHRVAKPTEHPQVGHIEQRILDEYQRWKGTRHRLGSNGSQGIDCSGFVKTVYQDAFNIRLPRTTKAQVHEGKSVSLNELQPGDLVFFKPPDYPRHVGIYLNRSQFVHASKSKGVTISKIDAYYWGKYFWTARRIIPASK
jgi:cell wall-associated NlpC family hydrolase